jgi:hypothetical protein
LNDIFDNRDSSGRISKWAMLLSEHVVDFEKTSARKLQIIGDFITAWTKPNSYTEGLVPESPWLIYYDGVWGSARAGAATVLISPSGIKLIYSARLQFTKKTDKCTNNITEYKAILLGLHKLMHFKKHTIKRKMGLTYNEKRGLGILRIRNAFQRKGIKPLMQKGA